MCTVSVKYCKTQAHGMVFALRKLRFAYCSANYLALGAANRRSHPTILNPFGYTDLLNQFPKIFKI